MNEQTIREQIAREIEANCGSNYACAFTDCSCLAAATIARGNK
jgi:hypothetical protein